MTLCSILLSTTLAAASPDGAALEIRCDPALERVIGIAVGNVEACRRDVGFVPDSSGHYDGLWVADSVSIMDAYRYFGSDYRGRLRALIERFSAAQAEDGVIPMAFWGKGQPFPEGFVDYGGRYDLAQNRKQNRDMESAYMFVHANYRLWQEFGDDAFVRGQLKAMQRALDSLDLRADPKTGLILATYGPPNSDASVDFAVPETTAHVYFNVVYVQAYREFAEIAAGTQHVTLADAYRAKGAALADSINRFLWNDSRSRYEPLIVKTPVTTDKTRLAYTITEDTRFPVVDNMIALYLGIPRDDDRARRLMAAIDESERDLKVWGRMVNPAYPDGFFCKENLYDGGNYHNGDVWPWFSNKYAVVLARRGLYSEALELLRRQAEVAARDQGFAEYYEDDADGAKKGAFHYAPTAASYLQAVVEGVFGLQISVPAKEVKIRPAPVPSAEIRCRLGQYPFHVAIRNDEALQRGTLIVTSEFRGTARVRFPLPANVQECHVLKADGAEVSTTLERQAQVACLVFQGDLDRDQCVFEVRWR